MAEGNKLSNETYVGVASHLHRRSAYRVHHRTHVLRTPVSPSELINRLITADPLSSTRSPLPSLDMLQLPRPFPSPNLSTIFSCFVAVSGDPLPQQAHRPRVIVAQGSFFSGRSHRSNTLSRDRLSGSCIVDEDDHVTDATLSLSLFLPSSRRGFVHLCSFLCHIWRTVSVVFENSGGGDALQGTDIVVPSLSKRFSIGLPNWSLSFPSFL